MSRSRTLYRVSAEKGLGLAIILCACANEQVDGSGFMLASRDSLGVRLIEVSNLPAAMLPLWNVSAQPLLTLGGSIDEPEYEFFRIVAATRLADGRIAVANAGTSEIRIYYNDGVHLQTLGGHGSGPGEFSALSWIGEWARDTLVAYDAGLRRLTWFAEGGIVARTRNVEPAGRGAFPEPLGFVDGAFLARSAFDRMFGQGERRDSLTLYFFDEAGQLADSLGPYPGTERYFHRTPEASFQFPPIFGRTTYVHSHAGRTVVGSTDLYAFDVYDGHTLKVRVRGSHVLPTATAAMVAREREKLDRPAPLGLEKPLQAAIAGVPARETVPAFADLRVDMYRRTWVREYEVDEGPMVWTIFDELGSPLARAELPRNMDVLEIGGDYVLGSARDSNDVESIVLYALVMGSQSDRFVHGRGFEAPRQMKALRANNPATSLRLSRSPVIACSLSGCRRRRRSGPRQQRGKAISGSPRTGSTRFAWPSTGK